MKSVAIVIVNYNGLKFQNECISDILKQTYSNYKIVIVDNGSTDGSIESAQEKFKDYEDKIEYIITGKNNGVAKGNNIGIEYSLKNLFDYTLLLNNDTELDENMLKNLIDSANDSRVVVPLIYYFNDKKKIWYAGGGFQKYKGLIYHEGIDMEDKEEFHCGRIVEYAPTCCMLIENSVFADIGIMDEKYFMYYDDTDFCMRLSVNKILVKYEPRAFMWHKVSSSSGGVQSKISVYYFTRNRFYFLKKFKKEVGNIPYVYSIIVSFIKYIFRFMLCKNYRYIYRAYFDYKKVNMYYQNI